MENLQEEREAKKFKSSESDDESRAFIYFFM